MNEMEDFDIFSDDCGEYDVLEDLGEQLFLE